MDLVIRAAVIFTFIWLVTRLIGRRELATMEPFDVILLVVVGDLVGQSVMQSDYSLTGSIIVLCTVGLLTVLFSYVSFKFPKLRPAMDGEPLVLVQDGQVISRNLRRERISIEELAAEARLAQVDDLAQVRFAVLETSGAISFITK
jgi:uncharacterized membrane protein YcaP (DUF421 family)